MIERGGERGARTHEAPDRECQRQTGKRAQDGDVGGFRGSARAVHRGEQRDLQRLGDAQGDDYRDPDGVAHDGYPAFIPLLPSTSRH